MAKSRRDAKRDASEIRLRTSSCVGVQKREHCAKGGRKKTAERIQHKYCPRPNSHGVDPDAALPWRERISYHFTWSSFLKREYSCTTTTTIINCHHYQ